MATRHNLFDARDPADLQPEQRQRELAAILAAGVIRMRTKRGAAAARIVRTGPVGARGAESLTPRTATCMPRISGESGEIRLELSGRSSPDGQCG
jgi:hypothetical protein